MSVIYRFNYFCYEYYHKQPSAYYKCGKVDSYYDFGSSGVVCVAQRRKHTVYSALIVLNIDSSPLCCTQTETVDSSLSQ